MNGHDKKTGERIERALCGPCQRMLRIRHWDRCALRFHFIDLDPPAPLCHSCWHRPRISKGTRRGRRRYFRFCGPCDRARRSVLGLPAYRGERGMLMQAEDQLRPVEERNRYPWPKPERESIYARSSSWEELLAPAKPPEGPKTPAPPKPVPYEGLPSTRRRRGRRRNYRLIALWAIADAGRAAAAVGSAARATCGNELEKILASIEPAQAVDRAALLYRGRVVTILPVDQVASRPSREDLRPAGSEPHVAGPTRPRPPPRGPDVLHFDARPQRRDRESARANGRGVAWPRFTGGSPCPLPHFAAHADRARAH